MSDPWLRRDYTHWWRLPPPLPPKRWPAIVLMLLAAVIAFAAAFGST